MLKIIFVVECWSNWRENVGLTPFPFSHIFHFWRNCLIASCRNTKINYCISPVQTNPSHTIAVLWYKLHPLLFSLLYQLPVDKFFKISQLLDHCCCCWGNNTTLIRTIVCSFVWICHNGTEFSSSCCPAQSVDRTLCPLRPAWGEREDEETFYNEF